MHDAPLSYAVEGGSQQGTTVLRIAGPLTLSNMFALQHDLRGLSAPVLILDMSEVSYMDSAGLGLLMNAYASAENHKRRFLLACVTERVTTLLQMTKLDSVLSIFPSVAAAEESI
jgi:anti-sigma B factor antagonist